MESTETALVLKVGKFREVDAWVRLFSPRQGVFTAFAFGGCVSRRRFCGCLDPFNLVRFKLKKDRKGYATLLEGALMEGHSRLRREGERLGMAVNCLKFVEAAHIGPTGSQAAYALLTDTLAALDGQEPPTRLLPLFFGPGWPLTRDFARNWRPAPSAALPWNGAGTACSLWRRDGCAARIVAGRGEGRSRPWGGKPWTPCAP